MSEINYSKLRSLSARKLISALERDGFSFDRKTGGHRQYIHPDRRRVTITFHHPSDTFRFKILKTMVESQAKWTAEDLRRLKLVK